MTSLEDVLKQVTPFLGLVLKPGTTVLGADIGSAYQQALADGKIDLKDLPLLVGVGTQIVLHEMAKAHAAAPPPTLPPTAVTPSPVPIPAPTGATQAAATVAARPASAPVDGNDLVVSSRPAQNPGNFKVFVDNNPTFHDDAAGKVYADEIEYECEVNGAIDIKFKGSDTALELNGHHYHLRGPGLAKLGPDMSAGYSTVLTFITSDGVKSALVRTRVKGVEKVHTFNPAADFPVPAE